MKALEAVHEGDDDAGERNEKTEGKQTPLERIFEIRLSPSQYPHEKYIKSNPLYGPWKPISAARSAIASDLARKIPQEKLLSGLRDWETGALGTSAAHGTSSDDWSEESRHTKITPWTDSMPWRLRGKLPADATIIRSLKQMYEDRQKSAECDEPETKD